MIPLVQAPHVGAFTAAYAASEGGQKAFPLRLLHGSSFAPRAICCQHSPLGAVQKAVPAQRRSCGCSCKIAGSDTIKPLPGGAMSMQQMATLQRCIVLGNTKNWSGPQGIGVYESTSLNSAHDQYASWGVARSAREGANRAPEHMHGCAKERNRRIQLFGLRNLREEGKPPVLL